MKKVPSVAIIIVNWNGLGETTACLESLKELQYENYQIILVDNGSTDGSVNHFKQTFPSVTLISLPKNTGFTGGNNAGIRFAMKQDFEYVLLLNNDTVMTDPAFLFKMVNILENDDKTGMVGPTIYYHQSTKRIWYAGGKLSLWKGWSHFHSMPKSSSPLNTGYITGCCLLAKKKMIDKIGPLNKAYFLSVEDVEWSLRAKRKGWDLKHIPSAKIDHKDSLSSRSIEKGTYSPTRIYYEWRNSIWFIREYANILQKTVNWPILYGFTYLYNAGAYVILGRWKKLNAMTVGIKDGITAEERKFKNGGK